MVKIIMHGCNGKMGQVITKIVKEDAQAEIVAGIDKYMGSANEYPVFDSLEKCDVEGDVIIDFSNPSALGGLLEFAVENSIPSVISTTGLNDSQISLIKKAATKIPVFFSANMSLGVNLFSCAFQEGCRSFKRKL